MNNTEKIGGSGKEVPKFSECFERVFNDNMFRLLAIIKEGPEDMRKLLHQFVHERRALNNPEISKVYASIFSEEFRKAMAEGVKDGGKTSPAQEMQALLKMQADMLEGMQHACKTMFQVSDGQ
jgi:hypothetical protein